MKRRTLYRTLLLAALSGLIHGTLWADGSAGADPFSFLFLDANARPVALGGAYTALANDANALWYNPAGLGDIQHNEATLMENQFVEGVTQQVGAIATRQGFGLAFNRLDSGNVQRATVSNPTGAGLGATGLTDLALNIGYGKHLFGDLTVGAALKYIRETLDDVSAGAAAVDIGGLYHFQAIENLALGGAVQNLGPATKFQSATESLPINLRVGAVYGFDVFGQGSLISLDVTKERTAAAAVKTGAETVVAGMMPLRIGFDSSNSAGPGITAGIGWILRNFSLDYAFVPFGALGTAHRFSMTLRWGGPPDRVERELAPAKTQRRLLQRLQPMRSSSSTGDTPYFLDESPPR